MHGQQNVKKIGKELIEICVVCEIKFIIPVQFILRNF